MKLLNKTCTNFDNTKQLLLVNTKINHLNIVALKDITGEVGSMENHKEKAYIIYVIKGKIYIIRVMLLGNLMG